MRRRKRRRDFVNNGVDGNDAGDGLPLYDLVEDGELIEASFVSYYGIRLSREPEMTAREFFALIRNIGAQTPLGIVCRIRGETDDAVIREFNAAALEIYKSWRARAGGGLADEDDAVKAALCRAFGGYDNS